MFFAAAGHARAETEFCPVGVERKSFDGNIEAVRFLATSARHVRSVRLVFFTKQGWFTAELPAFDLTARTWHYSSADTIEQHWTHDGAASQAFYVKFDAKVSDVRAWVDRAQVDVSAPSPWVGKGVVQCLPPGGAAGTGDDPRPHQLSMDQKDEDPLAPPDANAHFVRAQPVAPPYQTACSAPFVPAKATNVPAVTYPINPSNASTWSAALVAIDANGNAVDAWTFVPSGYASMDQETIDVALAATYSAPVSFCTKVPGIFIFSVYYHP